LGSSSTEVVRAQGPADFTERLVSLGYDVWHYDGSWVRLSTRDDRVIAWANNDGALAVELRPSGPVLTDATFARGSTRDDVVRLQGTPTVYAPQASAGMVLLQSLVIGLIGYSLGIGMAVAFFEGTKQSQPQLRGINIPWQIAVGSGLVMIVIMTLASLLSLRKVLTLEPAVVFRG
jgi:hypothetical protein